MLQTQIEKAHCISDGNCVLAIIEEHADLLVAQAHCAAENVRDKTDLSIYIERFCNRRLFHSALGYLRPVDFERTYHGESASTL